MSGMLDDVGAEYVECAAPIKRVAVLYTRADQSADRMAGHILAALAQGGYVTVKITKLEAMERRIEELEERVDEQSS